VPDPSPWHIDPVAGIVVVSVIFAVVLAVPVWLIFKAPKRGVWNKRPRHPFRIPMAGRYLETMGQGETRLQERLDLPPIGDHKRKGRRRM
jgi:hypothetical protein